MKWNFISAPYQKRAILRTRYPLQITMFIQTVLRKLTGSVSSEVEQSEHVSLGPLLRARSENISEADLNKLRKSKLRRILLLILVTFVAVVAASAVIYLVLHGLSLALVLLHHHKVDCVEGDLVCEASRCPSGMEWSSALHYCTVRDDFQCCTTSNMTRLCYSPATTSPASEDCRYSSKTAGVSPFIKQYCRPGLVWVEWLGQCLSSSGRG